jgi:hypothetical protein
MPILPSLRPFYESKAWRAARRVVLERAGGTFDADGHYQGGACCEKCGKPYRTTVFVYAIRQHRQPSQAWMPVDGSEWRDSGGSSGPLTAYHARSA